MPWRLSDAFFSTFCQPGWWKSAITVFCTQALRSLWKRSRPWSNWHTGLKSLNPKTKSSHLSFQHAFIAVEISNISVQFTASSRSYREQDKTAIAVLTSIYQKPEIDNQSGTGFLRPYGAQKMSHKPTATCVHSYYHPVFETWFKLNPLRPGFFGFRGSHPPDNFEALPLYKHHNKSGLLEQ